MIGNGLILLVLLTNKNMRTAVNVVIGNIAASDMIDGVVVSLNVVSRSWSYNYLISDGYCHWDTFLRDVPLNIRNYSLVILTYERFMERMVPRIPETTIKKALLECLGTWIFSIVFFMKELLDFAEIREVPDNSGTHYTCLLKHNVFDYKLAMSFLTLYLPTLITVVGNAYLFCKMRRARMSLEGVVQFPDNHHNNSDIERQVLTVIIVELTASVIVAIPEQYIFIFNGQSSDLLITEVRYIDKRYSFIKLYFIGQQYPQWLEHWVLAFYTLIAFRCALTPVVFTLASNHLRTSIKQLLLCCCTTRRQTVTVGEANAIADTIGDMTDSLSTSVVNEPNSDIVS